jgi:hypothetical protein
MRCSKSSYLNGPWHCISGGCDKGEGCTVPRVNALEEEILARRVPQIEDENAWREAYGFPLLTFTRQDARDAARQVLDYEDRGRFSRNSA